MSQLSTTAAHVMLSTLAALAVEVALEGKELTNEALPIRFGVPQGRAVQARPVSFQIPANGSVSGYQVLSADGTVLFRDDVTPPETFGVRGGFFDLPDLTVRL